MARKRNIELENIELKPQVIGHTYKKKSNIGRVIIMFVILGLVVYFIDDVSVFINRLLGRQTADTIEQNANKNNLNVQLPENNDNKIEYKEISNDLIFQNNDLEFSNFVYANSKLSVTISNNTQHDINVSAKKIFLETYDQVENRTLLQTFKLDVGIIKAGARETLTLDISKDFKVISVHEKDISLYPEVTLQANEEGIATLSCTLGYNKIDYTFKDSKLVSFNHNYANNGVTDKSYQTDFNYYQNLVSSYTDLTGFDATFSSSEYGFTAIIKVDLQQANLSNIENKYYYAYNEQAKVIKYEMETYGFKCE